jgi:hypothetical protein
MLQLADYVAASAGLAGNNNLAASDDPDANDDTGSGYEVGSLWYNQTSNALFVAEDVSAAAAVWTNVSASVTEKALEDLWAAAATPILATGDKFPFADVSGTDTIGTATAPDICSTGGALLADCSTTVDGVLTPDADGTRDIGLTGTRFAEVFCDDLDVTTNIIVGGTVDGRDIAADGAVLDTAFLKDGTTDLTGDLVINERADHADTPTAGKGQVWVRNDTPNVLVYTDDAGTDTVLGAAGAGAVTEKSIEDVIEALTPAAPAALDEILYRDISGTDNLGAATPQQIVETAHTAMGVRPLVHSTSAGPPLVTWDDDDTTGDLVVHGQGDTHYDTATLILWECASPATGAAVWKDISTQGAGAGDAWGDVVDAVITPDADGTRDLATTGTRFATAYIDDLDVTTNIVVGGTVDGRDIAADGTTLDAIPTYNHTESSGPPLVTWDDASGTGDLVVHVVGDTHLDTTTGHRYQCDDVTTGAAVWRITSVQHVIQGDVVGATTTAVSGRRIRVHCKVPGTITKVEAHADKFLSADASNYWAWNLGVERHAADILAADFDVNNGANFSQDSVYDLGTLTATAANLEVVAGDLLYFDQTFGAGTPASWGGTTITVAITIDTAI